MSKEIQAEIRREAIQNVFTKITVVAAIIWLSSTIALYSFGLI